MSEEKGKFERTKKLREALKKGAAKPTPVQTPCPVCGLPLRMLVAGDEEPHCGNRNCPNFNGTFEDAMKSHSGPLPEKDKKIGKQVAAAATLAPPKKPKNNHRTAKARDLRAKMRGRLPIQTWFSSEWDGAKHTGWMKVWHIDPKAADGMKEMILVKDFKHEADGLFRLMEELDCMFWEWFAKTATKAEKEMLTFAPDPPAPAPWPSPPASEGTAPESH